MELLSQNFNFAVSSLALFNYIKFNVGAIFPCRHHIQFHPPNGIQPSFQRSYSSSRKFSSEKSRHFGEKIEVRRTTSARHGGAKKKKMENIFSLIHSLSQNCRYWKRFWREDLPKGGQLEGQKNELGYSRSNKLNLHLRLAQNRLR